ncbi:MAG: ABC transporter ATP-binding protein [Euryarchaeota archaeon]|nr:ABC transporter ATP-binding protein [Euryarchaeota archaeon]
MIESVDLRKEFGNLVAIDRLSLTIRDNEIFGLVGPNGAGKTTFIRIVCGILSPTSGTVYIEGKDIQKNAVELKKRIGYLPEEPNLYMRPTAYELVKYFADLYGMSAGVFEDRAEELFKLVGLYKRRKSKVESFSKGMRQRLAFVRALIHDPDILIFDEPTMGLDPATSKNVRDFILEYSGNKTIIICTHYMEEADYLCDRIGVLSEGNLINIGTPEELKALMRQESLFEIEVKNPGNFLNTVDKGDIVERRGNKILLSCSYTKLGDMLRNSEGVVGIRSKTPTLEDVFIELTK